jgi:TRAP transporter TAXI family solute receptor
MDRPAAAALALSLMICFAACEARSAVKRSAQRPILRVSAYQNVVTTLQSLNRFTIQSADVGDSLDRLIALQQGSIDLAVTVADVTYQAATGRIRNFSGPIDKVRGIALMQPAVVHFLVRPGMDVGPGFRGMRVVLGVPNGINAALGRRLMNSLGIADSEVHGEFLPRNTAVDELLKGRVDSVILTGRLPEEAVARALQGGARLLNIDEPEIDRLRVSYPLLRRVFVPKGRYPSQLAPVRTVGVDLLLVCRADLDKDLVYELTQSYFEDISAELQSQTDTQRAPAVIIPLHQGAARYYREREMSR